MDVPGFALVTGAASGIGKACARGFALEGSAGIALLDINAEALTAAKTDIEAAIAKQQQNGTRKGNNPQILTYVIDITNEEQVGRVVNEIAGAFGRLDYVVNAAGVTSQNSKGAAFAKTDDWNRIMSINVTGSFFILRAAAQIMLKQDPILSSIDSRPVQRGSIVNLGSIVGLVGGAMTTAYTTSKHAVVGLTRTAALDYAKKGLRINAVCPGFTQSAMTTGPGVQEQVESIIRLSVPINRIGYAEEVADSILFLSGGRSSFILGTTLAVDGGYTAR
jgi:NAD(P)-dependent dehydrogenase (short-subunit alcohol dehydrogenase family)